MKRVITSSYEFQDEFLPLEHALDIAETECEKLQAYLESHPTSDGVFPGASWAKGTVSRIAQLKKDVRSKRAFVEDYRKKH